MSDTHLGFAYTRRHYDDLARMMPGQRAHVLDDQQSFVPERPSFWDDAACKGAGVEVFFPNGKGGVRRKGMAQPDLYPDARPLCNVCPSQSECLVDALLWETAGYRYGFRGGMTPNERKALFEWMRRIGVNPKRTDRSVGPRPTRKEREARPTAAPHGTRSRYVAGCSCDECKEAERVYSLQRKREFRGVAS